MFNQALLIPLLASVAAFLFAVSLIPAKNALSRTIEELEASSLSGQDGQKLGPMERAVKAVLSPERTDALSRKLVEAGWYSVTPAQIILRVVATGIAGLLFAFLLGRILPHQIVMVRVALQVICFVAFAYAPIALLERAAQARKDQVQKTLPDLLDMVASTVQAGLSMNAALTYAVDAAPGALGDEIREALTEIRLGRGRSEALKAAAERLNQQEFRTTIAAITQAERLGANIGKILSELGEDTRSHRIMIVEEHAAQLPVKMVFPMAFFLLPALFVIIFGSLAANYFALPHK